MTGENTTLFIVLLFLIAASTFFSICETSFSALNIIRIKKMASDGNKKAKKTLSLIEDFDKTLSSILVGNNIVSILSSALATVLFVSLLGPAGVPVATAIMTVVILLFAEIAPKTIAKEMPEENAMRCAGLLKLLVTILTPVNFLLTQWKKVVLRLFNVNKQHNITEEELLTYVEEVRQVGGINEQEESMIRSAIEFDELEASDIFTPRVDLIAVSATEQSTAIMAAFHSSGYSRLPVYEGTIDNIVGIILVKDFIYYIHNTTKSIEEILRPIIFIAKTTKIPTLLKELQQNKMHMAVVVDEFGGTKGIVTIEDILEELVGEIWDEHDDIVEHIKQTAPNKYIVSANTDYNDFASYFKLQKSEDEASTVGGWVMEVVGHIPAEGFLFQYQNLTITVSKILRHRVLEIAVSLSEAIEAATQ